MRSRLLPITVLIALFCSAGGCQVEVGPTPNGGSPTVFSEEDASPPFDGGGAGATPDASTSLPTATAADAAAAVGYQGSPLCNASRNASPSMSLCYPDDPTTAQVCNLAPDGGPYSATAGYATAALGCHVASSSDGTQTHAICSPAGAGISGSACAAPTDCAPGYECVGTGTCQHYCCSGDAECASNEFCDIQSASVPAQTKVPVCMPIHPPAGCQLLSATACSIAQTCAIVRQNGATSCVAVGGASAGDDCDTEHCGVGLVCLGTPGQRRCYQLCHTAMPAEKCSATQTCKGELPLFPDPAFGICQ